MNTELTDFPLLPVFLISVVVILFAGECGRRLGVRRGRKGGDNVATLEGAILGLLALMISFTFAMSLNRFEARRDAVLNEANAIGTTALRARLLPAPHAADGLKLLNEYVRLRRDMNGGDLTPAQWSAAAVRSGAIQESLWLHAKAVAATDKTMVPTGLFIQTLNEMIDDQEKYLIATHNRVPNIVLIALYCIATVASAFTGYAGGLESRRSRLPVYVMGILVASVILLIQDLDRPSSGFIRVSQQPLIDTAAVIAKFTE
jgi:CDP-diglyceride synthetase